MNIINAPPSVRWIIPTNTSWEKTFYPKLVTKIQKSDPYFSNHLSLHFLRLSPSLFNNTFLPLYDEQIASRPDYHINEKEAIEQLYARMKLFPYTLLAVHEKVGNRFIGGTIFSLRESFVAVTFRVFEREMQKKYKSKTTIDYWTEPYLFTYAQQKHKHELHHGKDVYPRYGHGIGLAVYKLYLGAKPFLPSEVDTQNFNLNESKLDETLLFFTQPNSKGLLQRALVFHPTVDIKNILNTLAVLCEWAEIKLEVYE